MTWQRATVNMIQSLVSIFLCLSIYFKLLFLCVLHDNSFQQKLLSSLRKLDGIQTYAIFIEVIPR